MAPVTTLGFLPSHFFLVFRKNIPKTQNVHYTRNFLSYKHFFVKYFMFFRIQCACCEFPTNTTIFPVTATQHHTLSIQAAAAATPAPPHLFFNRFPSLSLYLSICTTFCYCRLYMFDLMLLFLLLHRKYRQAFFSLSFSLKKNTMESCFVSW